MVFCCRLRTLPFLLLHDFFYILFVYFLFAAFVWYWSIDSQAQDYIQKNILCLSYHKNQKRKYDLGNISISLLIGIKETWW